MSKVNQMNNKLIVKIDITNWREEVLLNEAVIQTEDDIFNQVDSGRSTAQIARATCVSRELGQAPETILRPNDILYLSGSMLDITEKIANKKHVVEVPNGETYEGRDYVGLNPEGEEDEVKVYDYVRSSSIEGVRRARSYLENAVPGHIWSRLLIVAEGKGDVKEAGEALKARIDEMVGRLT